MKLRAHAGKVARVCNWALTGVGASLNGVAYATLSVLCLPSQTGGCLDEKKFCEDRTSDTACVCSKSCKSLQQGSD